MKVTRCKSVLWVAVIALALAVAPACSDDGTGEANNSGLTDAGSDSTDEPDAPTDGGSDGGQDVSDSGNDVGDSGGEDASDTGPTEDADAATENDANDGGDDAADATGDSGDAADTADAGEEVDAAHTGCAYPPVDASCPDGPHGPGSFLTEFVLQESGDCCHDYTGDGRDDSALGDLASNVGGLTNTDFNQVIDYQIQNGVLIYLFEYAYWSDEDNDPALDLDLFFGQDADVSNGFGPNLNGTGDFYIDPDSLDANGDPRSSFPSASVTNGRLHVSGGTAPLSLPVGADLVEVNVEDIIVEADVVSGTDLEAGGRVGLTNGELSGLISLDDLFGALNNVAQNCSCISTDPVFTEYSTDDWVCNSTQADHDSCQADANATTMCKSLANPSFGGCPTIASIVSNYPDLDTDGDGSEDTLTLGATFEAVGAKIIGVAP